MDASAVGKVIVKSPAVLVLSPPNANAQTALLEALLLYISAPFAVIDALEKVKSLKSHRAVVPDVVGVTEVRLEPPLE